MIDLSKNFLSDVISTNVNLKPVLVITEQNSIDILEVLTSDSEHITTPENPLEQSSFIPCIKNVSSVKTSIDYEKGKLKVNRLRCNLYNYYDSNTTLAEYYGETTTSSSPILINKDIYLFYKSPSTYKLNLADVIGEGSPTDSDCALIYKGTISRVEYDDKTISIFAEDQTQLKITDKLIPYAGIETLDQSTQDRIFENYKGEDTTVPMTFGSMNRAFTLPYLSDLTEQAMTVLLDTQPTTDNFRTARIPKMLESTPTELPYCLYIKKDNDYVVWDHHNQTLNRQYQLYSNFHINTIAGSYSTLIAPELAPVSEYVYGLWDVRGYIERYFDMYHYSGSNNNTILDIDEQTHDTLTGTLYTPEGLNDNGGLPRIFFRAEDFGTDKLVVNAETARIPLATSRIKTSTNAGVGRYLLLRLSQGIDLPLANISYNGAWAGNTFWASDYMVYQDPNQDHQGLQSSAQYFFNEAWTTGGFYSGWYVSALAPDVWLKLIPALEEFWGNEFDTDTAKQQLQNAIKLGTDLQLEDGISDPSSLNDLIIDSTASIYSQSQMRNWKNSSNSVGNKYFGSQTSLSLDGLDAGSDVPYNYIEESDPTWKRIYGLNFGATGSALSEEQVISSSTDMDGIAIYEYLPPELEDSEKYQQGLNLSNTGLIQSVFVENITERDIFASITGRKNYPFCEQLSSTYFSLNLESVPATSLFVDLPTSDTQMLDGFYALFSSCWENVFEFWATGNSLGDGVNEGGPTNDDIESAIDEFLEGGEVDTVFADNLSAITGLSDAPVWNNYYLWKEVVFKLMGFQLRLMMTSEFNITQNSYQAVVEGTGGNIQTVDRIYSVEHFRSLFSEQWLKSFGKVVIEYIIQRPVEYDQNYLWKLDFAGTRELDVGFSSIFLDVWESLEKDLTESVYSKRTYTDYTDLSLPSLDDDSFLDSYINNMWIYFDDYVDAINRAMVASIDTAEELGLTYGSPADDLSGFTPNVMGFDFDYNNMYTNYDFISGLQGVEGTEVFKEQLLAFYNTSLEGIDTGVEYATTDGVITKPSDIVMNILVNEMEFGKHNEDMTAGNNILYPDYTKFDINSLELSRSEHSDWKLSLSLNKKKDGKKIIEEILRESKSYPRFTEDGKFSFITIKNKYTNDDITETINVSDIISHKFTTTKRENIITSGKYLYRYDVGTKSYDLEYDLNIEDILPEYGVSGYDYYNIKPEDGHKEVKLKYHHHIPTAKNFAKYDLLNRCNQHNVIELSLSLNYCSLQIGDIIHIPLIDGKKVFGLDYSKVEILNGQPVYPLWIINETRLDLKAFKIKATQLHYLGTDGDHGFETAEEEYHIVGNMNRLSNQTFTTGERIPNWNFNPLATQHNNLEIAYFDFNGDGAVNIVDIVDAVNTILDSNPNITISQLQRMTRYTYDGSYNGNNSIDVTAIINLVNIILIQGDNWFDGYESVLSGEEDLGER
tara:strand:+ start:8170 stop:12513 length:4344 start_codon:yes stop_codon:yes gene_type:complete